MRLPDLNPVLRLQRALADGGVPSVVGGSAVLASLGLVHAVNDWDVLTDAPEPSVEAVLASLGLPFARAAGDAETFASRALYRITDGDTEIDLIVGFAIRTTDGVVAIPALPGGRWLGLTLARPDEWVVAYRAMGRSEKAELLQRALPSS